MYDFEDVRAASKDEQIRAFAMEKAIDALGLGSGVPADHYVNTAAKIEQFIKTGDTP